MHFTRFCSALLLLVVPILSSAQIDSFPRDYFIAPMKIPMVLAGNFGEIRAGHFHAGIDIKTQQVEGKDILAAADGYISRIKISLYGYGKVLYVRHPNGYTTTYAHLQKFNPKIEQYVNAAQYQRKSFTIELYPQPEELPVSQGEVIAISGNTGGSGGPHLHFEIRETRTETPVNPLLFGFNIKDTRKPVLKKLGVYPLNSVSWVNGKNEAAYLSLKNSPQGYQVVNSDSIKVHGKIGFGIEANDYLDGASNRCGVYQVILNKNDKTVFSHSKTRIGFDETRYINSHVDYYAWNKLKSRVQRSYLQPNNRLKFYHDTHNGGQLFFLDDTTYQMNYLVKDAYQNLSTLDFQVHSSSKTYAFEINPEDSLEFIYDQDNNFAKEDAYINIPAFALYDNVSFHYKAEKPIVKSISEVHHFQDLYTPLQKYATLGIKLDSSYYPIKSKVLVVSLDEKNKVLSPEGGTFQNGYIETKSRSLGPYCLMVDTVNPVIKPINSYDKKNMTGESKLTLKLSDNLSGIKDYAGYIDGKWALFEFDRKTGLFWFNFTDEYNNNESHELMIIVHDNRYNETIYTSTFVR